MNIDREPRFQANRFTDGAGLKNRRYLRTAGSQKPRSDFTAINMYISIISVFQILCIHSQVGHGRAKKITGRKIRFGKIDLLLVWETLNESLG